MALGLTLGSAAPKIAAPRGGMPFASNSLLNQISSAANNPAISTYTPNYGGIISSGAQRAAVTPTTPHAPVPIAQDYGSQLANDATLQQQIAAINAQGTGNAAALAAQRQRALIQYGSIPDNLSGTLQGNVNSDIDQVTRDLAGQATSGGISTVAQLQKAYQNQQASDNASLAARNMLHSGALGQHAQLDLTAYQQSQSQAQQALLDALTSYYQNYLGQQSQGQASLADATNQALQRIIAQINASTPPPSAAPTGGGGSLGGNGDYIDYTPPTAVSYAGPVVTGVPVNAPGAATAKKPGKTVGGYIPGGAIYT